MTRGLDLVAFQQVLGDHQSLDFVCSFADYHQRCVAVVAFQWLVFHEAVAAVNAHGVEGHFGADFAGVEFCHPGFEVDPVALVFSPGRVVGHQAGRVDLGRHIGQHVLDGLPT